MVVIVTAGVLGRVTGYRGADFNVYRGVRIGMSFKGKWDQLGREVGKGHRSFFDSKKQSCGWMH